jgi:Zn-dependent protease/predicted transcriptional regulator
MRWSFRIGSIAGIRVELHVTFVLFIGWIAVAKGLLTRHPEHALASVALILMVFGCVLLHELGHALAARRYGIRTREIVLLPIGGVARLERMPEKPAQEIVVAIAGPAVNVVIAALLWAVLSGLGARPASSLLGGGLLETLLVVNLMMLGFNLIPAFPMDGGRVLRALLAIWLPYVRATQIAALIGQGFALLFGVVGFFYNPNLMLVALFVFLAAGEEHAIVRSRASLGGLPVHAAMISQFEVLDANDSLQHAVDLLMAGSQQDFPVLSGETPVGLLTRAELLQALRHSGAQTPVREVIAPDHPVVGPGEPLEDALQRMREHRRPAISVVSDGRLVGMVTLESVSELLLVRQAMRRPPGGSRAGRV